MIHLEPGMVVSVAETHYTGAYTVRSLTADEIRAIRTKCLACVLDSLRAADRATEMSDPNHPTGTNTDV